MSSSITPCTHFIDFWTVAVPLSSEEFERVTRRIADQERVVAMANSPGFDQKSNGWRIDYSGKTDWNNNLIYYVSIWGRWTIDLVRIIPEFQRIPSRVDFRISVLAIEAHEAFKAWRNNIVCNPPTKRNFMAFNTKERRKTGERDRGGIGIGVGSMKSQRRVTFYMAVGEKFPTIEVQFRGKQANLAGYELLKLIEQQEGRGFVEWYHAERELFEMLAFPVVKEFAGASVRTLYETWQGYLPSVEEPEDDNPVDPYL